MMAREMRQQPDAVADTLDGLMPRRPEIERLVGSRRNLLFVGRGSSDNAATYGRYLLEIHAGIRGAMFAPSVATLYEAELDLRDTAMVSLSQSGATEEIVEVQEWGARHGAVTVAVTNDESSALAAAAQLTLPTRAGEERAVPATKSYLAQMAAMAVLGSALSHDRIGLDQNAVRLPVEVDRLLDERGGIDASVEALRDARDLIVTGRGLLLGTAQEVALKLEETCLRPVRGLSYADLRHGPIAAAGAQTAVLMIAPDSGPVIGPLVSLAGELRTRGVLATLCLGGDDALAATADIGVAGPRLGEALAPVAAVVPGQVIAECLARRLGHDVDAPRGLSKVTQTDAMRQ